MKNKLLLGIIAFLLASSAMFAGWGVGFGGSYYGAPGVVYAGPVHGYYHRAWVGHYRGAYVAPVPYAVPYVAPAPYVDTYVGPPPFYVAIWIRYRDAGYTARMADTGQEATGAIDASKCSSAGTLIWRTMPGAALFI